MYKNYNMQWVLCIIAKLFKIFFVIYKLEAHANHKSHGNKSFGGLGYLTAVIKAELSPL